MEEHQNRLVAQLVEITVQKTKHLVKILELTGRQGEAIDGGNIDPLSDFLYEKQLHIDKIDQLDREFNRIYAQFEIKPLQLAAALQPAITTVQDLLQRISTLERDNFEKVNKSIELVKNQLKDVNKGKRGLNAYKSSAINQSARSIDKSK